jgi:hypothetical protein
MNTYLDLRCTRGENLRSTTGFPIRFQPEIASLIFDQALRRRWLSQGVLKMMVVPTNVLEFANGEGGRLSFT